MATEETVTLAGLFLVLEPCIRDGGVIASSPATWRALANPTYQQVCSGATGHVEVVQ